MFRFIFDFGDFFWEGDRTIRLLRIEQWNIRAVEQWNYDAASNSDR